MKGVHIFTVVAVTAGVILWVANSSSRDLYPSSLGVPAESEVPVRSENRWSQAPAPLLARQEGSLVDISNVAVRSAPKTECNPQMLLSEAYKQLPVSIPRPLSSLLSGAGQVSSHWCQAAFVCARAHGNSAERIGLLSRLFDLLLEGDSPVKQSYTLAAIKLHISKDLGAWERLVNGNSVDILLGWEPEVQILLLRALPHLGSPAAGSLNESAFNMAINMAAQHPEPIDWDSPSIYMQIAQMADADYVFQSAVGLLRDSRVWLGAVDYEGSEIQVGSVASGGLRMLEVLIAAGTIPFAQVYSQVKLIETSLFFKLHGFKDRLGFLLQAGLEKESPEALDAVFSLMDSKAFDGEEVAWLLSTSELPEGSAIEGAVRDRMHRALFGSQEESLMVLRMVRKLDPNMRPSIDSLELIVNDSGSGEVYQEALFSLGCLQRNADRFEETLLDEFQKAIKSEGQIAVLEVANRLRTRAGSKVATDLLVRVKNGSVYAPEVQQFASECLAPEESHLR